MKLVGITEIYYYFLKCQSFKFQIRKSNKHALLNKTP